jgi:hypothetical protein
VGLYDDLTENIEAEVTRIYQRFGIPLSLRFRELLAQERHKSGTYRSQHVYSAEKWGLRREEINKRYRDIFEKYITLSRKKSYLCKD